MDSILEQKLAEFRKQFSQEYTSLLTALVALWHEVSDKKQPENLHRFLFEVHKLKGSSGALNFLNLCDRLGLIEQELIACKTNHKLLTSDIISLIDRHLESLVSSSTQPSDPMIEVIYREDSESEKQISHPSSADEVNQDTPASEVSTVHSKYADISIALVDEDVQTAVLTAKLLVGFGFTVDYFTSILELESSPQFDSFNLVMLDLSMRKCTQEQIFECAKQLQQKGIVVFTVSAQNTFEIRLAGVRAGISDFLLQPINITNLVTKIRKTFNIDRLEAHKILLLDDQANVGRFYKSLLETKGVEVQTLTDPYKLMDLLDSFHPDVFLLDMHMPEVNGIEVAKVIRQQHKYDYVPIIFLTADADLETKLLALECGADDVIPKDTSPMMIIDQIDSRILRGQFVRYLASRDSLTGVLNHGQIMEAAGYAHRLARRNNKPMNIAMIDLDYFKKVNDIHGHSGGDKVLIALGQLLLQSIRDTDYVGRYGGEEFMLVFIDSDSDAIEKKINVIRETFNQIIFNVNEVSFSCSFSAGVASSNQHDKVSELIVSADKALYRAKELGRNRVCFDEE